MNKEWNNDITKRYTHRSLLDFIARSMTYTEVIDYREFLKPEFNDFYSLKTSYSIAKSKAAVVDAVNQKPKRLLIPNIVKGEPKKVLIPKHCINDDGAIRIGFIMDLITTENTYIPHVKLDALLLKTKDLMEIDYTLDSINLYNEKKPNSYTKEDIGRLLDQRESILNELNILIETPLKQLQEDNNERETVTN